MKKSILFFTILLGLVGSAFANHTTDIFMKIENLAGDYAGYYADGTEVFSCEVNITRTQVYDERQIEVTITDEKNSTREVYSESNPISFNPNGSIFIERHRWVGGQVLGGTFKIGPNDHLETIVTTKVGPRSGRCTRLEKIR